MPPWPNSRPSTMPVGSQESVKLTEEERAAALLAKEVDNAAPDRNRASPMIFLMLGLSWPWRGASSPSASTCTAD